MTLTSATAPGMIEIYTSCTDIANDVVDARVWGAIHWRTASVRGQRVGWRIGQYAVHHFLRPLYERDACDGADSEGE